MNDGMTNFIDKFSDTDPDVTTTSTENQPETEFLTDWELEHLDEPVEEVEDIIDARERWYWLPKRRRDHQVMVATQREDRRKDQHDKLALAQRWSTTRTCLVSNQKGGSGKTPVSVLLASALGNNTGLPPILVDLGPTGNLRNRLEAGDAPSDLDAMAEAAEGLLAPGVAVSRVRQHTIYQDSGRFDALISREHPPTTTAEGGKEFSEPTITQQEASMVLNALELQYALAVLDSGNNLADKPTAAALAHGVHALVVPTFWERDSAKGALDTLKRLDNTGFGTLASSAIIAHVNRQHGVDEDQAQRYKSAFTRRNLTVIDIPYDPAIDPPAPDEANPIIWSELQPATQKASIQLAAEVMRRFALVR